ncbi:MAG: hypothetical protein K1W00_10580 [Lachnospiraceae bacterium]
MFKKLGKVFGFIAVAAAAVAGGMAIYKKCQGNDEDFDDFEDFDDDDFDDDFDDMDIKNRGYTSISPEEADTQAETATEQSAAQDGDTSSDTEEN